MVLWTGIEALWFSGRAGWVGAHPIFEFAGNPGSLPWLERKKLYGFDGGKEHKFVRLDFENVASFNKAKGLWYGAYTKTENGRGDRKLLPEGLVFEGTSTRLYEANIPPLLRFFHIQEISPSGWVSLPIKKSFEVTGSDKKTNCDFEYVIDCKEIVPLNDKETRVPYKICSFDM